MSIHEEEIEITTSESNEAHQLPCERICLHQGDRICYNDMGDKELLNRIQEDESDSVSLELDSLHSGESLFKTFTFNAQDSDPDMRKCMSFWKSILEKNIKPVKCTLLHTKKNKEKIIEERQASQQIQGCDGEDTQKMWMDIYADLQRRKLDKLKLVRSKKCDPCDEYIDEDSEKKQDAQDIKNLNQWKSQTKPSKFGKDAMKSQILRTLGELQTYQVQETPKTDKSKVVKKETSEKSESTQSYTSGKTESLKAETEIVPTPEAQPADETRVPIFEEERKSVAKSEDEAVEKESLEKESVCCLCSCSVEDCICEEESITKIANQLILEEEMLAKSSNSCESCTCNTVCICDSHNPQSICDCGCRVMKCICQSSEHKGKPCSCGCVLEECVCQKLDKWPCSCGCGMEECICQQLFSRSCKCGHANCECDIIEALAPYMETLETAPVVKMVNNDLRFSRQCQTDDSNWVIEATQKEGSYCVICGHFNCFCTVKKVNF